jgi:hypothetical protein
VNPNGLSFYEIYAEIITDLLDRIMIRGLLVLLESSFR